MGGMAMITERLIEQNRRAKDRFNHDEKIRENRQQNLKSFRQGKKADYKRIDDSDRINARADMLGIKLADGDVGEAADRRLLERILTGDDLQSSDFLRVGAQVASCVGRIHIRNRQRRRVGFGTGFMISPRLAMTNNHVLEAAANGANSMIEFDLVEGLVESVQRSRFFSLDPETFFLTSPGLDYTIIALGADYDDAEARRRGWLSLIETSGKVVVGERLNIIQHSAEENIRVVLDDLRGEETSAELCRQSSDRTGSTQTEPSQGRYRRRARTEDIQSGEAVMESGCKLLPRGGSPRLSCLIRERVYASPEATYCRAPAQADLVCQHVG